MVLLGTDNYPIWSIRTKAHLGTKGLWSVVDPDSKLEDDVDPLKNEKARSIIVERLEDYQLLSADKYESARELWQHFKAVYQANSNARRALLRKQLLSLKMEAGEPVSKFVQRAKGLWTELRATGHEMAETELCWTVLSGLPHSFGMISTVLMAQADDLVLDTMLPQLMQVEQQHSMEQQEAEVSMFGAMARMKLSNRDRRCFKCGKAGHVRANCPEFGSGTRRAVAF